MAKKQGSGSDHKIIASHRRARHDYAIDDTFEAGLVLQRKVLAAEPKRKAGARAVSSSSPSPTAWLEVHHDQVVQVHHDQVIPLPHGEVVQVQDAARPQKKARR